MPDGVICYDGKVSFRDTLLKLAEAAAGSNQDLDGNLQAKFLTPRAVHRIAYQIGIPSQGNPYFSDFARHVTGTDDLGKMNQWQLHTLVHMMVTHLSGVYTPLVPR